MTYLLCSQGPCAYVTDDTPDGKAAMYRHHMQEHGEPCALIRSNTPEWLPKDDDESGL